MTLTIMEVFTKKSIDSSVINLNEGLVIFSDGFPRDRSQSTRQFRLVDRFKKFDAPNTNYVISPRVFDAR